MISDVHIQCSWEGNIFNYHMQVPTHARARAFRFALALAVSVPLSKEI